MKARITRHDETGAVEVVMVDEAHPDVIVQANMICITLNERQARKIELELHAFLTEQHNRREQWVKDSSGHRNRR